MLEARLKARVSGAVKMGTVTIPNYRMQFSKLSVRQNGRRSGKCCLIPEIGTKAYGVVYEIPDEQVAALDEFEGAGKGYTRKTITVTDPTADKMLLAEFYDVDADKIDRTLRPYDWYRDLVHVAAIENKLPLNYINDFILSVKTMIDPGQHQYKDALEAHQLINTNEHNH